MTRRIVPVSTLVNYLKQVMDNDPVLHGVMIEGEISNLRKPFSGHWYFSLKDSRSSLPCVMFAGANQKLNFPVNNGDKVVLKGDVSVYAAEGRVQMIVSDMKPSGIGELYLKLEELKKKLSAEGLFAPEHKKKLPAYPMDIALVTGNNTAAREDVLITFRNRWPAAVIHEYPCPVQGADAAVKIIASLSAADCGGHDVILLVRGGGSLEDLWCFNDEALARFIYAMHTPVVTGIGHEIDFTLADYTADVRANTPTGAVEAATPDIREVIDQISACRDRMQRVMESRMRESAMQLDRIYEKLTSAQYIVHQKQTAFERLSAMFTNSVQRKSAVLKDEIRNCENRMRSAALSRSQAERIRVVRHEETLRHGSTIFLQKIKQDLARECALLDAYSPLKILERGYSLVEYEGQPVRDVNGISIGDDIRIRFARGTAEARITKKEEEDHAGKENI